MCAADFSELADQRRRGPEVRGLEQILLRSNAVLRPLAVVVLAGEDALADRAPSEDRDALPLAVGEDLGFDLPLEHVVPYLVRGDVRPREMGSRLREIADREVAHPDVPDPARPVEGLESLHRLPQGDLTPRIRPMHLIKVDLPDPEALQTGGTRFLHVVRAQMPATDFRRDEDAVPPDVPNRSGHDALGVAVAVRLRGVHEVDPKLHGALHRLAAVGIANVGTPRLPAGLPHPQSDRRDVRSTTAQRHVLHPTAPRPPHR